MDPTNLPARGSRDAERVINPLVLQPALLVPHAQLTGTAQRREPHSRPRLTASDKPSGSPDAKREDLQPEISKSTKKEGELDYGNGSGSSDESVSAGKFTASRAASEDQRRSASQTSVRSTKSTRSLKEMSVLADAAEEKANRDPGKFSPLSIDIKLVEHFGCRVPDINCGGFVQFEKLLFDDEASTMRSLHWLDILGQIPAPPYSVSLKLA